MRILGLDCSGHAVGAAVVEDGLLLGEYTVHHDKQHSAALLPLVDELTKQALPDLHTLDALAVTGGPGSFTGIRIGAVTAKGMAMVLDKPIVPVSTVACLAYNMWGSRYDVCPLMDARRNQTYTGVYRFTDAGMEEIVPTCAVPLAAILERVNENGRPVVFLGDGVPVFAEEIRRSCRVTYTFAPAHMNRQRAASVAAYGEQLFSQGRCVSAAEFLPEYYRMSQAERERLEALHDH